MKKKTPASRQDYTLPAETPKELEEITRNHVDSYNYFIDKGMDTVVSDLGELDLPLPQGDRFKLTVDSVSIAASGSSPAKARVAQMTYDAPLQASVSYRLASRDEVVQATVALGNMPIMVKSTKCVLNGMGPAQLAANMEEPYDTGGYFIVNGIDKIIRLIIGQRQNYPFVTKRPTAVQKGENFSQYVANMKCVSRDGSSIRLHLHHMTTGSMSLGFLVSRRWFYIPFPVILRALVDGVTDREIYEKMVQGRYDNQEIKSAAEKFLRAAHSEMEQLKTQADCLQYLGPHFRQSLGYRVPPDATDIAVAKFFIQSFICIHLTDPRDKFECLLLMAAKLLNVANGINCEEDVDATTAHEIIMPGQIMQAQFKSGLITWLQGLSFELKKKLEPLLENPIPGNSKSAAHYQSMVTDALAKTIAKGFNVGGLLKYFLSTGNVKAVFGDTPQLSGWSIVGERINYFRYFSHFRSIHRGAFFTEMRTSTIRKLRPESWGFLCPVHTPDGSPIGLLNHLACLSRGVTEVCDSSALPGVLSSLGMISLETMAFPKKNYLPVVLDGKLLGRIQDEKSEFLVSQLRLLKVEGKAGVPSTIEIVHFSLVDDGRSVFPGVYLFTRQGRFVRPVKHLESDNLEYIGSLEQLCLQIACVPEDVSAMTTHQEFHPTNMLDILANLTPFCNNNQSPRNLYQCQMAKQTMGTPMYSYPSRYDNKIWRINTPQRPLARTHFQDVFDFDNYPAGTNACVAVISYTGYDMEDAMIINKSAYERGLGHGTVYKTQKIDLTEISPEPFYFDKDPKKTDAPGIGPDGLPVVGYRFEEGDSFYSYWNNTKGVFTIKPYKSAEPCYIESVTILEKRSTQGLINSVVLKLRFNRNPIIGDKFSSRHGQKGVLSQLWPQTDMPFTESGMTPDIIINPHAFPSRMTVGMLIESMAAKSGAIYGNFQDSTPFKFNEESTAVDHFGKELVKAGYNYYGNEPMYSGITGTELKADIYFGVVYYQRLRHMVSDKYQVRSVGPSNAVTGQPIKGRKKGGGVRFGEMERDSLIAHGAAFLLLDRLMNCSDAKKTLVCSECGGILSVSNNYCIYCNSEANLRELNMPAVWRYLSAELAAMNISASVVVQE